MRNGSDFALNLWIKSVIKISASCRLNLYFFDQTQSLMVKKTNWINWLWIWNRLYWRNWLQPPPRSWSVPPATTLYVRWISISARSCLCRPQHVKLRVQVTKWGMGGCRIHHFTQRSSFSSPPSCVHTGKPSTASPTPHPSLPLAWSPLQCQFYYGL